MACPYFFPVNPRTEGEGPQHAMLPLGSTWTGLCHAVPADARQPDDHTTRSLCNLGYARGLCTEFPGGEGPDAVRFTISEDDGVRLRVRFVVERDHHPYSHGWLEYSRERREFHDPPSSEILARQAGAYVESYLRRKQEASGGLPASK